MGNRIAVHPAWLIFGMLAGGSLLGFLGRVNFGADDGDCRSVAAFCD